MNDANQPSEQTNEALQEMEGIFTETTTKVKMLEQEQKRIVTDYVKKLEQKKIEKIRKSLSN